MDEDISVMEKRRKETIKKLVSKDLDYCRSLPFIGDYKIYKTDNQICKRFIASLFFSWRACEYSSDKQFYETEAKEVVEEAIEQFKLKRYLFPDEERMMDKDCDEQTIVRVSWEIECCYALAWVLGIISTEEMENYVVDVNYGSLFDFIKSFNNFSEIKAACTMRSYSEIMSMLDLYYNYHWVCVENRINPQAKSGNLNEEVIMERRRAIEWLITRDRTWDDISLDT